MSNPTKGFYMLQEEANAGDSGDASESGESGNENAVEQSTAMVPVSGEATSEVKDVAPDVPAAPAPPVQPKSSPTSSPSIQQIFSIGIYICFIFPGDWNKEVE